MEVDFVGPGKPSVWDDEDDKPCKSNGDYSDGIYMIGKKGILSMDFGLASFATEKLSINRHGRKRLTRLGWSKYDKMKTAFRKPFWPSNEY